MLYKTALAPINLFAYLIFLSACALPQPNDRDPIRDKLDEYLIRQEAFGFSGAVIVERNGKVVLKKGYGYADRRNRIPFTPDTLFPVQSISKQFTAASILLLEQGGRLETTDSIASHLATVPEDKRAITIHHLLTHTSGFGDNYAASGIFDLEDAVDAILRRPLAAKVGERMIYSNDGYELLAAIVERTSGRDLAGFVREKLLEPAGIVSALYPGEDLGSKDRIIARAYNSFSDNGPPRTARADWDGYGSGDLIISATDLHKWEVSLRNKRVLSDEVMEKIFTPYSQFGNGWHYGYGWFIVSSKPGDREYYHGGGDIPNGYTASYNRFPDSDSSVIIFTNEMIDEEGLLRVVKQPVIDITFGRDVELPPAVDTGGKIDPEEFTGVYRSEAGHDFRLLEKEGRLLIGAANQRSIDFLTRPPSEMLAKFEEYERLSSDFVSRLVKEGGGPAGMRRILDSFGDRFGEYEGIEVLGSYTVSESRPVASTYVRLDYAQGSGVVRFVRVRDNTPYPLANTPFPAMTPVARQEAGGLVAYYPVLRRSVQIDLRRSADGKIEVIQFSNGSSSVSARKIG